MESNSTIKCHLRYMPLDVIVVFIAYTNSVPLSWKAQLVQYNVFCYSGSYVEWSALYFGEARWANYRKPSTVCSINALVHCLYILWSVLCVLYILLSVLCVFGVPLAIRKNNFFFTWAWAVHYYDDNNDKYGQIWQYSVQGHLLRL